MYTPNTDVGFIFKEGLQPQPLHSNILKAQPCPIFPKIHCRPHMYYSIRVHPNTHPQHMKVLKHFVYIWYGSWLGIPILDSVPWDGRNSEFRFRVPEPRTFRRKLKSENLKTPLVENRNSGSYFSVFRNSVNYIHRNLVLHLLVLVFLCKTSST